MSYSDFIKISTVAAVANRGVQDAEVNDLGYNNMTAPRNIKDFSISHSSHVMQLNDGMVSIRSERMIDAFANKQGKIFLLYGERPIHRTR